MSVTFTIADQDPLGGFRHGAIAVACSCGRCGALPPCPSLCEEWATWGECDHLDVLVPPCPVDLISVNVANVNARLILDRLGLSESEDGLCGEADPIDFLGRVLSMNVGRMDDGTAPSTDGGPGTERCQTVDCGLKVGYFEEIAGRLSALALRAQALGLMIGWS